MGGLQVSRVVKARILEMGRGHTGGHCGQDAILSGPIAAGLVSKPPRPAEDLRAQSSPNVSFISLPH